MKKTDLFLLVLASAPGCMAASEEDVSDDTEVGVTEQAVTRDGTRILDARLREYVRIPYGSGTQAGEDTYSFDFSNAQNNVGKLVIMNRPASGSQGRDTVSRFQGNLFCRSPSGPTEFANMVSGSNIFTGRGADKTYSLSCHNGSIPSHVVFEITQDSYGH